MQAILIYLLKATACLGILFLYYYVALRNKRFHYYNRFYLLMSVALSMLMPLLNIELWQFSSSNQQVIHLMNVVTVNTTEVNSETNAFTFSWSAFLLISYTIITLLMLIAFSISIKKLYRYRRLYPGERLDTILFINTDLEQAPFSFFNNLFWKNTLDITDATGKQIFKHELTHIEQKHSWDKLFLRLVTLLFWMNPFYWLIQKELSLIHEFIADEKAIENRSAEAFALLLLQSQYGKNIFSPAQSFNYSPIKRRLLMLTTSSKGSYSYARRILVLPLLAITVLLFAFKLHENKHPATLLHTNAPFTLLVDAGHGGDAHGAYGINGILEKDINLIIAKKVEALAPAYGITVKMTRTADATVDLKTRMNVIKAVHPNAFVSIHVSVTEEQQTNKNEVNVYVPRMETNSNYAQSRLLGSSLLQVVKKDFPVNEMLMQRKEEGIYVIDQNPYPAVVFECGYMNNPENIKQLQDADKAEQLARDILQGVVTYANANAAPQTTRIKITDTVPDNTKNPPLYMVDGKIITPQEVKDIDVNTIESINVLKDSNAIKQYGEKGENGVIIIKLKNGKTKTDASSPDSVDIDLKSNTVTFPAKNLTIRADKTTMKTATTKQPIYIVDGKEIQKSEFDMISADDIISISVWKDSDAINKFGEKAKNGVVEIKTKKNKTQTAPGSAPKIVKEEVVYPEDDSSVDFTKDSHLQVLATVKNTDTTGEDKQQDDASEQINDTPIFPGGAEGWKNYLSKHLNTNILKQEKAPPGTYTVVVSFTVGAQGDLSDVKAENDPGYGTAEEAVRVIKRGPKWIPVKVDGKTVVYHQKQAISFLVEK